MADLGLKRGYVITTGTTAREIGGGISVVPWRDLVSREVDLGLGS